MSNLQLHLATFCCRNMMNYGAMLSYAPHDVIIACRDGVEIKAHRMMLCKASRYFINLFLNLVDKGKISRIDWNIDESVAKQVIRFVYENECDINRDNLLETLRIADQYNIVPLVRMCEERMWDMLNSQNCFQLYVTAYSYCLQNTNSIGDFVYNALKIDKEKRDKTHLLEMCKQMLTQKKITQENEA